MYICKATHSRSILAYKYERQMRSVPSLRKVYVSPITGMSAAQRRQQPGQILWQRRGECQHLARHRMFEPKTGRMQGLTRERVADFGGIPAQLGWQAALAAAGDDPADQLLALLEADFQPAITTTPRLAAWVAFWGEAQSRPMYQQHCGERDAAHIARMEAICTTLAVQGGCLLEPVHAARVLRLVTEGTWLDLMTDAKPYQIEDARRTVMSTLALCFPRHFTTDGAKRTAE